MEEECSGWINNGSTYELRSMFDEYISVDKTTGEIEQYGYGGLVSDWFRAGLLKVV
jgi:hypothetical protein